MNSHDHLQSPAKSPIWHRILAVLLLAIIVIGNLPVLAVVFLIRFVVYLSLSATRKNEQSPEDVRPGGLASDASHADDRAPVPAVGSPVVV